MKLRSILLGLAATVAFTPAVAQEASAPVEASASAAKAGQVIRDANNLKIGRVERVEKDGSVKVIYQSRMILIPANTLTVADGKVQTSLTRKEIGKLD